MQEEAMKERLQMLVEALERAKACNATTDDWKIIYFECGISKENK